MINALFRFSLMFVMLIIPNTSTTCYPLFQEGRSGIEAINDSARYYLENGKVTEARSTIQSILKKTTETSGVELADTYLILGDLEESEGYVQKALDAYWKSVALSEKNSGSTAAASRNGIANVLIVLGKYDSVLLYINESLKLDSSLRSIVMNDLVSARFWQAKNLHDKSLPFWQRAYDHASQLKDAKLMAIALAGMGSIQFTQDPDKNNVIEIIKRSNALCDSSRHANIIARNYVRIANAYMVMSNSVQAEKYLSRAKKITDISKNLPVTSYMMSSFAILKAEQGDIPAAVNYAGEPLRIKREFGQLKQLQNDLLNISEWYMTLGKYSSARETLREGITTSTSLNDVVYLYYFYDRVSQLDSLTGNYREAYSNLKRSMVYKDSAESLKRFRAIEEIGEKYEAEQKEKTIAEKELVIEHQRYQQLVLIGASLIAVLLLIVILIALRNRHKVRLQSEKQKQDHLRLQTIVHTQEEVQQSIARDIHDGLVQVLGAAKMSLEAVNGDSEKQVLVNRIREASKIMDEACAEARNISHQILPYSLMKDGLKPALEELLRKSLISYEFSAPREYGRLAGDLEINIFRIAQELVNNIVKHAEAHHVVVHFSHQNNVIKLSFRDDGKGFENETGQYGVGLTNIYTRAELIGGTVEIQSNLRRGTFVQLTILL